MAILFKTQNALNKDIKAYFAGSTDAYTQEEQQLTLMIASRIEAYNNNVLYDASLFSLSVDQQVNHIFKNDAPDTLKDMKDKNMILATFFNFEPVKRYFNIEKKMILESAIYQIANKITNNNNLTPIEYNKLSIAKKELEDILGSFKNEKQYIILGQEIKRNVY